MTHPENEPQKEFDGFVPVQIKEIRNAAAKLFSVSESKKESAKEWKEKEDEAKHNLAVLMKKHKQLCCAAGPYRITLEPHEKVTVVKGVDADDHLKNKHLTDPGKN